MLTGTVTNNLSLPQWSLLAAADTTSVGSLSAISGSNNTILYTAPPVPPIYTGAAPSGFTQGAVTVDATTTNPPQGSAPIVPDELTFFITAPSVSVSLSPSTVTVPFNNTFQFTGYEIGSANNALTWQVNGVTGGIPPNPNTPGISAGTITTGSTGGLYTAPASGATPITGDTVTITMTSQADPTKTATATITLQ